MTLLLLATCGAEAPIADARQGEPDEHPVTWTILIVEDEASLRSLTARILREEGCELLEAGDGLANGKGLTRTARAELRRQPGFG